MKIITVMNEKGGTGKSTIATNLAAKLHRDGQSVVLIDADPQGTARDWRAASPDETNLPPVVALDRPQMLSSISSLQAQYVVIDSPAKADSMAAALVRISHVALLVIQPCGADIWASAAIVKLVNAKLSVGGAINTAFLLNRVSGSTNLSQQIRDGEWNEYGIRQMDSTIGNRVAFAEALTFGVSVYDLADRQARAEIDLLTQEMEDAKWL